MGGRNTSKEDVTASETRFYETRFYVVGIENGEDILAFLFKFKISTL